MSVTLWPTGLVLTDALAARLDAACVDRWLLWYRDTHGGEDPPGWPAPSSRIALAEWGIKRLCSVRLQGWEHEQQVANLGLPEPLPDMPQ